MVLNVNIGLSDNPLQYSTQSNVCVCTVVSDSLQPHGLYVVHQDPLSTEFSRQEYWSGLPFHLPGGLPDPGIKPTSPVSPAWQVDSLPLAPPGKPYSFKLLYPVSHFFFF